MDAIKEGCEEGKLSTSQRQSAIRLIQKKSNLEKINSWRPILLMNVDTKLFAKVLAARLRVVCQQIIGEEQLAYLENNEIREGHLIINRVIEEARAKNLSGILACIDFKSAFLSIRHDFMWKALEKYGVGNNLISMLKILYKNTSSCIMNYGTTTGYLDLKKGCRQGDSTSAYLFILAVGILLNAIRKIVDKHKNWEALSLTISHYSSKMKKN